MNYISGFLNLHGGQVNLTNSFVQIADVSQLAMMRHEASDRFGECRRTASARLDRQLRAVRLLGQGTACADVEQGQRAKTHGVFWLMGVFLRDFLSSDAVVKIP